MSFACPAGHASDESDYCSVCGAAIVAVAPRAAGAAAPLVGVARKAPGGCPVCGEPRVADARFCEVCRYDFLLAVGGPPPVAPSPPPAPAPMRAPSKWQLEVTIDPSLDTEPDPAVPSPTEPPRVFPIELPEMLVGRRDDKQHIHPAVPVHDPGSSRRHARFLLSADGTVSFHDLASTNGTKLNGSDVVSGSIVPLKEGDEVTLGRWTRIRLGVRT
jgi:hypothetical protein